MFGTHLLPSHVANELIPHRAHLRDAPVAQLGHSLGGYYSSRSATIAERWATIAERYATIAERNLSPDDFTLLAGQLYNQRKTTQGGDHGNQHSESKGKVCTLADTAAVTQPPPQPTSRTRSPE